MAGKRSKFVVHDHKAVRAGHHFDLRIAYKGVLKSWAVPKAKFPEKGDRLLAVQTPDHPMSWYNFTGTITDVYGKGTVRIFDRGPCIILKWAKNRIGIEFRGNKIEGVYWLIKLAGKSKSWLLLKGKRK